MKRTESTDVCIRPMLDAAMRMARRHGRVGYHEPDDIAQMAILKLLKRVQGEMPGLGWLYRVVQSVVADARRDYAREAQYVLTLDREGTQHAVCESFDEDGNTYAQAPCVSHSDVLEPDVMPHLMAVLEELNEPLRQVLVLFTEGYSYEEISAITRVPLGTVRSRLYYARKAARGLVEHLR